MFPTTRCRPQRLPGPSGRWCQASSAASGLVLDLDRLPAGVRPSLSLQLDRQGIQITGAAGPQVELIRDSAGLWSVIRKPRPRRP